jgi:formylglycine-generating enzyme
MRRGPWFGFLGVSLLCSCTRDSATGTAQSSEVDAPALGVDPIGDPNCPHPPVQARCEEGFCRIEPGCFIMGSPRNEVGAAAHSDIQVQVTLTRPFLLGQTVVTRKDWVAAGLEIPAFVFELDGPPPCTEDECPLVYVSFAEAVTYTNRLSERAGLSPCYELSGCGTFGQDMACESIRTTADTPYECEGYRLPMEAEWEYAARAGTRTAFYTGRILPMDPAGDALNYCRNEPNLEPIAWYCNNSGDRSHPVAQKEPNGWGLYDMLGNVFEFCNDVQQSGYPDGPSTDPMGKIIEGRELVNPEHPLRISRGGYYGHLSPWVKASSRNVNVGARIATGFRVARTLQ